MLAAQVLFDLGERTVPLIGIEAEQDEARLGVDPQRPCAAGDFNHERRPLRQVGTVQAALGPYPAAQGVEAYEVTA